jgi:hypothetical protein
MHYWLAAAVQVSLADNYAEDENYYDPTLPSPQFARTSLTLPQSYSEEELDDIWTNSTEVVAPENSSQGSIWWNNYTFFRLVQYRFQLFQSSW